MGPTASLCLFLLFMLLAPRREEEKRRLGQVPAAPEPIFHSKAPKIFGSTSGGNDQTSLRALYTRLQEGIILEEKN